MVEYMVGMPWFENRIYAGRVMKDGSMSDIRTDVTVECDRFELDTERWHSLHEQKWEYRVRVKHAQARGGQTTLEAYQ